MIVTDKKIVKAFYLWLRHARAMQHTRMLDHNDALNMVETVIRLEKEAWQEFLKKYPDIEEEIMKGEIYEAQFMPSIDAVRIMK